MQYLQSRRNDVKNGNCTDKTIEALKTKMIDYIKEYGSNETGITYKTDKYGFTNLQQARSSQLPVTSIKEARAHTTPS